MKPADISGAEAPDQAPAIVTSNLDVTQQTIPPTPTVEEGGRVSMHTLRWLAQKPANKLGQDARIETREDSLNSTATLPVVSLGATADHAASPTPASSAKAAAATVPSRRDSSSLNSYSGILEIKETGLFADRWGTVTCAYEPTEKRMIVKNAKGFTLWEKKVDNAW